MGERFHFHRVRHSRWRLAPLSFDIIRRGSVWQSRFFAFFALGATGDPPGAASNLNSAVKPGAKDVNPGQSQALGLRYGNFNPFRSQVCFGADVNVAAGGSGGIGGDKRSLQEAVRDALQQMAVLEQARLADIGVDHQTAGTGSGADGLPLGSRGKVGAAPLLQPRLHNLVNHRLRGPGQGIGQAGIAAAIDVIINIGGVKLTTVGHDLQVLGSEEIFQVSSGPTDAGVFQGGDYFRHVRCSHLAKVAIFAGGPVQDNLRRGKAGPVAAGGNQVSFRAPGQGYPKLLRHRRSP